MAKTLQSIQRGFHDTAEITLEDWGDCFEAYLEVDYCVEDYWPGNYDHPPEGGELELTGIRLLGALVGPDCEQATPEQCKELLIALNRDDEALARIERYVSADIEM